MQTEPLQFVRDLWLFLKSIVQCRRRTITERTFVKTFFKASLQLLSSAVLALAIPIATHAQDAQEYVHATGSNLLRVGDGTTDVAGTSVNKRYLEEIANARIFFQYLSIG